MEGEADEVVAASTAEGVQTPAAPVAAAPASPDAPQDPMAALGQASRQLIMLPVLWASSKVDWTEPTADFALSTTAIVIFVICVMLIQATLRRIENKADPGRVRDPGDSQHYTKRADGTVSIAEYDSAKVKEARTQLLMSAAIGVFLYVKWQFTQPMLVMCLMQPMQLYDNKALHIYLRGCSGDEYNRPWAAPGGANPLQQWVERKKKEMEQTNQQQANQTSSDKKSN
mmetsp:Transcript_18585/g.31091  ORF Transcript_18585/g.31091 Transcript_18585/m.31091 type:complete len:228 (-) Transcript_18585:323-1006(-)